MASTVSILLSFALLVSTLIINTDGLPAFSRVQKPSLKASTNEQTGPNGINENATKVTLEKRIQGRNVIMPRICYLARVNKQGIYQKICLPYGENA